MSAFGKSEYQSRNAIAMSALGHERTFCDVETMSASPLKADIWSLGIWIWYASQFLMRNLCCSRLD